MWAVRDIAVQYHIFTCQFLDHNQIGTSLRGSLIVYPCPRVGVVVDHHGNISRVFFLFSGLKAILGVTYRY